MLFLGFRVEFYLKLVLEGMVCCRVSFIYWLVGFVVEGVLFFGVLIIVEV